MPESVQSSSELSIHLSLKRTSRELLLKNSSREKKYGEMYGKFKTRLGAFWHSYIPPIFFLKSFPQVQKFPIYDFFRSDVL